MQNEIREGRRYVCEKPWNWTLSFFIFHRINALSASAPIKHLREWSFFLNTRNDYLRRGNFVGVHKKKSTHNIIILIYKSATYDFFSTFFNASGTIYIISQILVHSHVIGFLSLQTILPMSKEKKWEIVKPMVKMKSRKKMRSRTIHEASEANLELNRPIIVQFFMKT